MNLPGSSFSAEEHAALPAFPAAMARADIAKFPEKTGRGGEFHGNVSPRCRFPAGYAEFAGRTQLPVP